MGAGRSDIRSICELFAHPNRPHCDLVLLESEEKKSETITKKAPFSGALFLFNLLAASAVTAAEAASTEAPTTTNDD